MIRINLLPFRQARKKENIRRQVSIFLLSVVLVTLVLVWYSLGMDRKIELTRNKTAQVNVQIARYKEKADRVTAINAQIKRLNEKLKIVASLQVRKNEQQLLLEELADRVVKERMWLESMTVDADEVVVKGVAFDNPTIADFMRNLEASPLFSGVDLKRSLSKLFGENVALKTFELTCKKKNSSPEAATDQPKKKRGKKG